MNIQLLISDDTKPVPSRALIRKCWSTYVGNTNGTALCFCCKNNEITINQCSIGQIIAGKNTIKNIRPICASCYSSIGSTNMSDFMRYYGYGGLAGVCKQEKGKESIYTRICNLLSLRECL